MGHSFPQDSDSGEDKERTLRVAAAAERWKVAAAQKMSRRVPISRYSRLAKTVREKYLTPHARFDRVRNRARFGIPGRAEKPADEPFRSELTSEDEDSLLQNPDSTGLEASVARSSHFILDARRRDFLADLLKMRFPPVKIYANQAADSVARANKADALTFGDRILFRSGKFKPQTPEGLALLGHELTHAAQSRFEDRTGVIRSSKHYQSQELEALQQESALLSHLTQPHAAQRSSLKSADIAAPVPRLSPQRRPRQEIRSSTGPSRTHAPGKAATAQPKAALEDRRVSPAEAGTVSPGSSELSESQMRLIKEEVYRDIMDRIRTDFERGG